MNVFFFQFWSAVGFLLIMTSLYVLYLSKLSLKSCIVPLLKYIFGFLCLLPEIVVFWNYGIDVEKGIDINSAGEIIFGFPFLIGVLLLLNGIKDFELVKKIYSLFSKKIF